MSNMPRSNTFLYSAVISVNSVALYCGSTFSWTSPIISLLRSNDSSINPLSRPITVIEETGLSSIFALGTFWGVLFSMACSNKIGRKKTLMLFSSGFFIVYSSFIFMHNIIWYLIGRFIIGLGVGSILSTLPNYITEITEDSNRGKAGSIFGIAISSGHTINFCIAPFVSFHVWNVINVIPVLIFYLSFVPFMPESPYYLMAKDDEPEAKRSLRKFRGHSVVGKELEYIKHSIEEAGKNNRGLRSILQPDILRGLFIACGSLMCLPITGFNAVSAYLQPIFSESGGFIPYEYSLVIIGVCQIISNISTTFMVERLGRKILLLVSAVGAVICLTLLGTYFYLQINNFNVNTIFWLPIVSVIVYVFLINTGFGSVPWIISGEIFPLNFKTLGTGIANSAQIITNLIIISVFPYMSLSLGMAGSFWVFAVTSFCAVIFIALVVPETKGKSFDQIQELLKR